MYNSISISLGEMVLKGKNRGQFEKKLTNQINKVIKKKGLSLYRDRGKIFIDTENDIDELIKDIKNIFGIVYVTPCFKTGREFEEISQSVIRLMEWKRENGDIKTFKILSKRADKSYPFKSMDLNRDLGGVVLKHFGDLKVDVHNPDVTINVDLRSQCYLYTEKYKGTGGLPLGTNGEGLVLLSGGIDSPVAAYMMARRGVKLNCVTFHAYPFTSERANDKVRTLTERLAVFCGQINLYYVNMLDIYTEIRKHCPEDQTTIIARRFMMRIGEKIANDREFDFLITGESLGQVASQTAKSLGVIDSSVNLPILRPLIGMDKTEIIEISRNIGTYEDSILPYEDCCSVFSPKHPQTKPRKDRIELSEEKIDIWALIDDAINKMEIEKIQ
ncbi:thiamine biosynthesis protein ThiI [Dethiosulfatibacter aminovorans DSM 17477]|uniref:Probable tRNA sulfurtransferase n=1 Tax=Dethiosulfatibacter aminovorans DSM 17477 TaxID=1121476 RepID=A0A1M6K1T1_9FIRM|nr:tRNA uracil 4-sulfurtransferase ThiI [Dethiosulfatibacter aminovorans]SHJ52822.1 thiamine biosynthesis protein ThiI [Dethiosulfatibacter aminovorans DSM 17477]